MSRATLLATMEKIILKAKPNVEVTEASLFKEDFGYDSLDTINFFFELENQTNIEVPEEDIEDKNLVSIGVVLDYLEAKS